MSEKITIRKIDVNSLAMNLLLDEVKNIRIQLDLLEQERDNKKTLIIENRKSIENIETEIYSIEKNIALLKENIVNIGSEVEIFKSKIKL